MLAHEALLFGRDCVQCPDTIPACDCQQGYQCVQTSRSCSACPSSNCVASPPSGQGSGGASAGPIAGGVIAAILVFGILIAVYLYYARKKRLAKAVAATARLEHKPDVPARAEAVLSRPDPVEKPVTLSVLEPETMGEHRNVVGAMAIDPHRLSAQPSFHGSLQSNPFADNHSIRTASATTQSTNVIPIALIPHSAQSMSPMTPSSRLSHLLPSSGVQSPNRGLASGSQKSSRSPNVPYASSTISGFSSRASVLTSGSFSSDIYDSSQILTAASSNGMHQVLGVAKAEVISMNSSNPNTPMSSDSLKSGLGIRSSASKRSLRSPLAQSSFGPADTLNESEVEGQEINYATHDPFDDGHSAGLRSATATSSDDSHLFSQSTASTMANIYVEDLGPMSKPRPLSTVTQAASIIGAQISGATVVRLNSARSVESRYTSAKIVSPRSGTTLGVPENCTLQEQQARALAVARARAAASGLPLPPNPRRISEASVASAGADSLLEAFTFVPPSPISNRPPRSPLAQQSITNLQKQAVDDGQLEPPRPRHLQGMSTASASSALEGYTFHIDSGSRDNLNTLAASESTPLTPIPIPPVPDNEMSAENAPGTAKQDNKQRPPPSTFNRPLRQRASLDTLALTSDLSAFPLNFDATRGSFGITR